MKFLAFDLCCMALLGFWLSSVLENVEYGMYVNSKSVVWVPFSVYVNYYLDILCFGIHYFSDL